MIASQLYHNFFIFTPLFYELFFLTPCSRPSIIHIFPINPAAFLPLPFLSSWNRSPTVPGGLQVGRRETILVDETSVCNS